MNVVWFTLVKLAEISLNVLGAVYMSPTGRAGPTRRDPACYLKSLLKIVTIRLHEKRASPPRRDLAIVYPSLA